MSLSDYLEVEEEAGVLLLEDAPNELLISFNRRIGQLFEGEVKLRRAIYAAARQVPAQEAMALDKLFQESDLRSQSLEQLQQQLIACLRSKAFKKVGGGK